MNNELQKGDPILFLYKQNTLEITDPGCMQGACHLYELSK